MNFDYEFERCLANVPSTCKLMLLFLVSPKLRLFSNLVVFGNSCFSFNLVTVRYRSLVAAKSRNPDIDGKMMTGWRDRLMMKTPRRLKD